MMEFSKKRRGRKKKRKRGKENRGNAPRILVYVLNCSN